jgi:imidazoleglycerol phosphate dehydratase HisB
MEDEYLTKCVVDPSKRTVYLYSSEGDKKVVECDTVDEFMNVLSFVRDTCPEERLSYANPLPK